MATILDRFKELGFPINKSHLSWAGEQVSNEFCKRNLHGRVVKYQEENGDTFKVWDYPEAWVPEMDEIIIKISGRG